MSTWLQHLTGLLLIGVSMTTFGQTTNNTISIGHVDSVYSKLLNENRRLFIYMPQGAANARNKRQYPVVYLLDGGINFPSVVGALRYLSEVNQVCPPMMVVGILNTDRTRDLTPTRITLPGPEGQAFKTSGGAKPFTRFLQTELMPYIDAHYPTSPDRLLIGHSLGGLFALNTFVYHTDLFRYYLAIDPSLTWDNQNVLRTYLTDLAHRSFTNKSLFLTAANFAGLDSTQVRRDTTRRTIPTRSIFAFADAIAARNEPSLDWANKYYAEENHFTVPLPSEYAALKFFFRKKRVQLTAAQLGAMAGRYRLQLIPGKDDYLELTAQQDHLVAKQLWDGGEFKLLPESELSYYCLDNPYTVRFIKDGRGQVKQVEVMNGQVGTKVNP